MPVVSNLVHLISRALRYLWRLVTMRKSLECELREFLHELHHHVRQTKGQWNQIMTTQAELVTQLAGINTELQKVGVETDTLLQKIADLQNALPADASPELVAAVQAVADQAKIVDDKVPDAPTT